LWDFLLLGEKSWTVTEIIFGDVLGPAELRPFLFSPNTASAANNDCILRVFQA
jgi:hypothetical protein